MDDQDLSKTNRLPLERELLRAGALETTPGRARRRVLANLGLLVLLPPATASSMTASASASLRRFAGTLTDFDPWSTRRGILVGLVGAALAGAVITGTALAGAMFSRASLFDSEGRMHRSALTTAPVSLTPSLQFTTSRGEQKARYFVVDSIDTGQEDGNSSELESEESRDGQRIAPRQERGHE